MTRGMRIPHTTTVAPFGGRSLWLLLLWLAGGLPATAGEVNDWILHGTIVLSGQSGYAIVEQSGSRAQSWRRTGTDILPGMRLAAVFADHAIVVQDGGRKRIDFGARLAAAAVVPVAGSYHLDPLRLPEIAAMVDIIPQQQNGQVVGYYANSIPEKLRSVIGLQPGDLVRRINGIPINDKLDPSHLYGMLQSGDLKVEVVRRGQPVQLVYRVDR